MYIYLFKKSPALSHHNNGEEVCEWEWLWDSWNNQVSLNLNMIPNMHHNMISINTIIFFCHNMGRQIKSEYTVIWIFILPTM